MCTYVSLSIYIYTHTHTIILIIIVNHSNKLSTIIISMFSIT